MWVVLLLLVSMLVGCGKVHNAEGVGGDTIIFRHARNIHVVVHDDYRVVTLDDPWNEGRSLARYILVNRDDSARVGHLPEGQVLYVPMRRAVVFNTAHASLMAMLHAEGALAGVADLRYMLLPWVHERVGRHLVVDCGEAMSPDVERIVDMGADAVFLSPFENSGGFGRLDNSGIPLVQCAEYMEPTALARAEWMRFYGMLWGREHEADSLFAVVEGEYNKLRDEASLSTSHPSMITEKLTGSTWYVAGGRSTVARLIADAGGNYPFAADEHSGSLPLSLEKVLDVAGDADVWVFNTTSESMSYDLLRQENGGYATIKAFKNKRVYSLNSLKVPYFEEVSFRPDYLLREYISVLYGGETRYYKKLLHL